MPRTLLGSDTGGEGAQWDSGWQGSPCPQGAAVSAFASDFEEWVLWPFFWKLGLQHPDVCSYTATSGVRS